VTLAFSIAGIPVRIHPWFFLTAVALGAGTGSNAATIALWIVIVLFSVLLHEMGHAIAGRAFGLKPQIDLHGMGGTTSWQGAFKLSSPKRVVVSLAGPAMGIVLGVALLFAPLKLQHPLAQQVVSDLLWVNLGWGIFNLIPMLPLDGGNVMAATLTGIVGPKGMRAARIISIALAVALLALALKSRMLWIGFLAALFAVQNFQAMRRDAVAANDGPVAERMQRAVEALRRDEGERVVQELEPVVAAVQTPELRMEAHRLLAFGYVSAQRWAELVALLRGEAGIYLPVADLEEMEGRATALGLHEVAKDLAEIRRRREATPGGVGTEFRA
jgi:Zn-dependent protease